MKKLMNAHKYLLMVLVVSLLFSVLAIAQEKAADLPDAASVIEDYIKATGGRDAYEKHSNMKLVGSFAMPAMGIAAPLTTYQEAPNKNYTIIESDAFGTIENGTDGQVQWEKTMMTGAKIKEGEEKAVSDRQGTFNLLLRWKDFFKSAETVAVEDLEGRSCYKVVMVPNVGEPENSWFDVETHLMLKRQWW